jgi:hypothetical protein
MPTRCNRWIFIADLIACSTCFGHHYAHHQELESIIQVVAALSSNPQTGHTTLMMGIMVPKTCWASNKIWNKNSSVASSWHFISTYYRRCTVKATSNLTSSIFMDSITKIMYTCIPKLELGDRFFFDTLQLHILHIFVCASYVQVVPSNFKQKMYHIMVQRTIT